MKPAPGSPAAAARGFGRLASAIGITALTLADVGIDPTSTPEAAVKALRRKVGETVWSRVLVAGSAPAASALVLEALSPAPDAPPPSEPAPRRPEKSDTWQAARCARGQHVGGDGAKFCVGCGAPLGEEEEAAPGWPPAGPSAKGFTATELHILTDHPSVQRIAAQSGRDVATVAQAYSETDPTGCRAWLAGPRLTPPSPAPRGGRFG